MDAEERTALWPWILLAIAAPIVAVLSVGMQHGYCLDADPSSGAESFCVTGPTIGPGTVILLVFCGLLAAVAIYRIVRIALERRR